MAVEISEGLDTVCMPRNGYSLTLDTIIKVTFTSPLFVGNWVCFSAASHSELSTYMVSPFTRQPGSPAWGSPWRACLDSPGTGRRKYTSKDTKHMGNLYTFMTIFWVCTSSFSFCAVVSWPLGWDIPWDPLPQKQLPLSHHGSQKRCWTGDRNFFS